MTPKLTEEEHRNIANWSRFVRDRRGRTVDRVGTLKFAGEESRAKKLEGKWGQDGRESQ